MAKTLVALEKPVYGKLLSQLKERQETIQLISVEFRYPDSFEELPDDRGRNEPLEENRTSWKYAFNKTDEGFCAKVQLKNEIQDVNKGDPIFLNIVYRVNYATNVDLPSSLFEKFAYEKLLPRIWPYFRQQALDTYFKAGLLWVIIPLEPNALQ